MPIVEPITVVGGWNMLVGHLPAKKSEKGVISQRTPGRCGQGRKQMWSSVAWPLVLGKTCHCSSQEFMRPVSLNPGLCVFHEPGNWFSYTWPYGNDPSLLVHTSFHGLKLEAPIYIFYFYFIEFLYVFSLNSIQS